MTKIKLIHCEYCRLSFEGMQEDICPRCHHHFLKVVASYPKLEEEDAEKQIQVR